MERAIFGKTEFKMRNPSPCERPSSIQIEKKAKTFKKSAPM